MGPCCCSLLTFALDRDVVALHDGQHGLCHTGELDEAGRAAFRFQWEHSHCGRGHLFDIENTYQLLLRQARRGIEEVQDLWRMLVIQQLVTSVFILFLIQISTLLGG